VADDALRARWNIRNPRWTIAQIPATFPRLFSQALSNRRAARIQNHSMHKFVSVILLTAATASAQLPPSSLTPKRPVPAQPQQPLRPVAPVAPQPTPPVAEIVPDISSALPNTLSPEEIAQGWKLLFDGTRLLGWRGVQKSDPISAGWQIANGELNLPKDVKQMDRLTGGDLMTIEQYWDFEFRFDWRSTVSANSGIRYLVSTAMGQSPSGLEYQIIDDTHNTIGLKGGPLRRSGALDNVLAVGGNAKLLTADPLNKRGEPWNEGRIVVRGNVVEHWLNGEKVLEFTLGTHLRGLAEKNYNREEPFASRPHALYGTKGKTPIVILDQGTEVAFRNLKVRPLVPQAIAQPGAATLPGTGTAQRPPNPFLIPPKKTQ
jgi:Domain of Unknown Function (DUF1080)